MSRNYDNWERLVGAVLKRDELWHLFHAQSITSADSESSSGFSFGLGSSSIEDEDEPLSLSTPNWTPDLPNQEHSSTSRVHDLPQIQSPVEIRNQSFAKTLTSKPFWKRALKIEVPKLRPPQNKITSENGPKTSPTPSPRTTLVTPGSSDRSHSRHGKGVSESPTNWPDSATQKSYPLPLPPTSVSNLSSEVMPAPPRTLERMLTRWKKGKLLCRSATGDVYLGFNSAKGAMCAMKEVSLSSSPESKQIARELEQEIRLLSTLSHPNILQYYGSEMAGDRFYIYCEYMSAGSLVKILKQYGKLGEPAIRRYTKQILSGLAYLHSKSIAHRNIKGAHILVDSNGIVKLSNFGTEKRLSRQLHSPMLNSLLVMDSPYWMAPEAIMNPQTCSLQMDIWSLGCTVVEMATSTPPMSPYEGVRRVLFKIANKNEIPAIPDHLSEEGKDFLKHCFQWNPVHRATASQLLEHPFVRSSFPVGGVADAKNHRQLDLVLPAVHISRTSKSNHQYMLQHYPNVDGHTPRRYISAPASPVGSPLPRPNSPQHLIRQKSPSHRNRSISPQEMLHQKRPSIIDTTTPSYWNPNILRSNQHLATRAFQKLALSDKDATGKQFCQGVNEQAMLDVQLPQHLLKAPAKYFSYCFVERILRPPSCFEWYVNTGAAKESTIVRIHQRKCCNKFFKEDTITQTEPDQIF